jgi:hypothetical protein
LNQGREFLPEGCDTAADEFNFNEAILIDHLVRPCEHILRNRETDLLGRSSTVVRGKSDDQPVARRRNHNTAIAAIVMKTQIMLRIIT